VRSTWLRGERVFVRNLSSTGDQVTDWFAAQPRGREYEFVPSVGS
jgi:hypothetical protein